MTLAFFVKDDGEIIPVSVSPGKFIRLSEIQAATPVPPSHNDLTSMTKDQLKTLVKSLKLRLTNIDRVSKDEVVAYILQEWNVVLNAAARTVVRQSHALAAAAVESDPAPEISDDETGARLDGNPTVSGVGNVVEQDTEETYGSSSVNPSWKGW